MEELKNVTVLPPTDIRAINEMIQRESAFVDLLRLEMDKVIVGQKYMIDRLLIGLLADGHILLEGVPGLAKTLAINTLSKAIQVDFSRIQFTPDLLPADLLGTMIYNQKRKNLSLEKGLYFQTLFLPTRSIEHPRKCRARFWKPCRKGR